MGVLGVADETAVVAVVADTGSMVNKPRWTGQWEPEPVVGAWSGLAASFVPGCSCHDRGAGTLDLLAES